MKRRDFLKATGVFGATLALRGTALEGSEGLGEPTRLALFWAWEVPWGDPVGSVALHANGGGQLIVKVRLDQGNPDEDLDVYVDVYDSDGSWAGGDDVGALTTNDKGEGSEVCTLPIAEYVPEDATEIQVQIRLRQTYVRH